MQFHDEDWKAELRVHLEAIRGIDPAAIVGHTFEIEKPIFFSAFIVRKLVEDTAVTDRLKSRAVTIHSSPSNMTQAMLFLAAAMGPLEVHECFDMETQDELRMSYHDLASEIIHSDAFVWDAAEGQPPQFWIASYRNVTRRLLWVPVGVYADILQEVVDDAPKRWWRERDGATGKITRHAE
jgi:hypothetical protein